MVKFYTIFITLAFLLSACDAKPAPVSKKKNKDHKQIELSKKLKEISGIAFTPDGRLFGHDDERAVIYELDKEDGHIIKSFYFGIFVKRGDFEDIEIVNNDFYMVASNGVIYKFKEGNDNQNVEFESYMNDIRSDSDVEGLCYDAKTNSLLLAFKGHPGDGLKEKEYKAVYSFSLKTKKLNKKPFLVIDLKELNNISDEKDFNPSAITIHPKTGEIYMLSASSNLVLKVKRNGRIISVIKLKGKDHYQPEGLSFWEGNLFICDEGKKRGTITIYNDL